LRKWLSQRFRDSTAHETTRSAVKASFPTLKVVKVAFTDLRIT